ncbi:hypothetical protein C8Q74DRAFT_1274411 [Fomes fomentarius]|nr:hypothetical protein C8Q74DRAFT_1274411 [Fomes fomentarius]
MLAWLVYLTARSLCAISYYILHILTITPPHSYLVSHTLPVVSFRRSSLPSLHMLRRFTFTHSPAICDPCSFLPPLPLPLPPRFVEPRALRASGLTACCCT